MTPIAPPTRQSHASRGAAVTNVEAKPKACYDAALALVKEG